MCMEISLKKYEKLMYNIIGAAIEVHEEMNWGLLEAIYTEALHIQLEDMGIESKMEAQLPCYYKGRRMKKFYQADLVVDEIMIELKSAKTIIPAHRAQLFNYMRLTHSPVGLLINFGQPSLQGERYAWFEDTNECVLLDKHMNPLYAVDSELSEDEHTEAD